MDAFTREERKVLLLLTLIQFANTVDFVILMPLGPRLMRAFAIGPREFSWMVSSYAISASVMGFLSSVFIDRFDRKKSLLFLFAGFAAGTLYCALAPDHRAFIFARSLTGAFGGILSANVLAIVGDLIPASRRGAATGQIMSAFAIASIVGIPLGLGVANLWDWHAPFVMLASLCVILWGIAYFQLPPIQAHLERARSDAKNALWSRLKLSFFGPGIPYALLFSMVIVFSAFVVIPMISPVLVANGGVAEKDLPWVYLFGGGITFFTSRWTGKLADRHGKVRVFRIMALISILPILLLTRMPGLPLPGMIALVAFFMFAMNGRFVPMMALLTGVVPPERRGNFMNVLSSLQQLALSLGALVAGFVVTQDPQSGRLLGYQNAGWIAVGSLIFCIIGVGWIRSNGDVAGDAATAMEKSP